MAIMIRWDVRSPADTCDIVAEETPSSRPSAANDVPRSRSWYLRAGPRNPGTTLRLIRDARRTD